MIPAKDWVRAVTVAVRIGAEDVVERQIARIQADALCHAAEKVHSMPLTLMLLAEAKALDKDCGTPPGK